MPTPLLKIGTRGSPLALAQARETRSRLSAALGLDPEALEIVVISTTGDRIRDRPLAEIGGKGLFTKELEEALLAGAIDLAVHSMKDMPAQLPEGLTIAAILPREDPRDAFLSPHAARIEDLPPDAVLGSSSVRRVAQALRIRPDLKPVQFRGNVETRLRKLDEGVAHATFLACAGLNRLGMSHVASNPVPLETMLPAVAQGAVGIETRDGDRRTREMAARINDALSEIAVAAERGFLAALDGSCRTPLAGHATVDGGRIAFRGMALTPDGAQVFETSRAGDAADAARLGTDAGEEVRRSGGAALTF